MGDAPEIPLGTAKTSAPPSAATTRGTPALSPCNTAVRRGPTRRELSRSFGRELLSCPPPQGRGILVCPVHDRVSSSPFDRALQTFRMSLIGARNIHPPVARIGRLDGRRGLPEGGRPSHAFPSRNSGAILGRQFSSSATSCLAAFYGIISVIIAGKMRHLDGSHRERPRPENWSSIPSRPWRSLSGGLSRNGCVPDYRRHGRESARTAANPFIPKYHGWRWQKPAPGQPHEPRRHLSNAPPRPHDTESALARVRHLDVGSILSLHAGIFKSEQRARRFVGR